MQLLSGKNVIITGGARGIGFAIAQELINQGARIVICSRTKDELKKALLSLNKEKKVAFGITCDVSKLGDCKKLIKFSKNKLKKIDVLVNNAGIYGPIGPFEKINLTDWERAFQINFTGMVYCSYLVIPEMQKNKGGKIINLCGAGVGANSLPRFSAYFTSKFAVAGFTEVLADEVKEKNIQVNSISPGGVNTYLNEYLLKVGSQKSGKKMYQQALNQKKSGGTPPELGAKLVAFLASKDSNHITGRLLSAKWNPIKDLKKIKLKDNLYKLRRIDKELFYEK